MAAPVQYSSTVAAAIPSRKMRGTLPRTGSVAHRMMMAPEP